MVISATASAPGRTYRIAVRGLRCRVLAMISCKGMPCSPRWVAAEWRSWFSQLRANWCPLCLQKSRTLGLPLTVPGMDTPPSPYDITVRVARDDDQPPDLATFAVAVTKAASSRDASVVSAHTAGEVICVVCVAAQADARPLISASCAWR